MTWNSKRLPRALALLMVIAALGPGTRSARAIIWHGHGHGHGYGHGYGSGMKVWVWVCCCRFPGVTNFAGGDLMLLNDVFERLSRRRSVMVGDFWKTHYR